MTVRSGDFEVTLNLPGVYEYMNDPSVQAYMLEQVYKQMEKTIMRSDDSQGDYEKMFSDMRIQQYAERATEQGGIGLAQQLYESMKLQASAIPPAEVIDKT